MGNEEVIKWVKDIRNALDALYHHYKMYQPRLRVTERSVILELRSCFGPSGECFTTKARRIERRVPMNIVEPHDALRWWEAMEEIESAIKDYAAFIESKYKGVSHGT